eukprot:scaffold248218_cov35-Tisochrysis_lutea.AAC.4
MVMCEKREREGEREATGEENLHLRGIRACSTYRSGRGRVTTLRKREERSGKRRTPSFRLSRFYVAGVKPQEEEERRREE